MAFSEVYVDPSIGANTGNGMPGTPYGDLQHALNMESHDATNGKRFNIKSGTAEAITSALDWTSYGTSSFSTGAPVVFQGYTSTAGDGGIGRINCNSGTTLLDAGNWVRFQDMKLMGSGALRFIGLSTDHVSYINCHIDGGGGRIFNLTGDYPMMAGCTLTNFENSSDGVLELYVANYARVFRNLIDQIGHETNIGIEAERQSWIAQNIILLENNGSDCIGIDLQNSSDRSIVAGNSIGLVGTKAGTGIRMQSGSGYTLAMDNLIQGFTTGIDRGSDTQGFSGNSVYDCTTAFSPSAPTGYRPFEDNEILTASPFADLANGDVTPQDVGNVLTKSWPHQIGANHS